MRLAPGILASAAAVLIAATGGVAATAQTDDYPYSPPVLVSVTTLDGRTTAGDGTSMGAIISPSGPEGVMCRSYRGYYTLCTQNGEMLEVYYFSFTGGPLFVKPGDALGQAAVVLAHAIEGSWPYTSGLMFPDQHSSIGTARDFWLFSVRNLSVEVLNGLATAITATSSYSPGPAPLSSY